MSPTKEDAASADPIPVATSDEQGPGETREGGGQGGDDHGGEAAAPTPNIIDGMWEELSDEKSIHKACQVMRDIARPDRKHREERRQERKRLRIHGGDATAVAAAVVEASDGGTDGKDGDGAVVPVVVDDPDTGTTEAEGLKAEEEGNDQTETNDVEMKGASSLAEEAAVEVVDNALDGTPTQEATNAAVAETATIEV